MKGMLFVELTGQNENDFREIIAKQKEYSIFPDGFEDLFRRNPKIHLRSEVLNLLGIIDLWNGIGGRKREFWSLSDAANALQQFEIPLRDFINRIGEFNNYESIKSSLGVIHDVVLLFTNYDEFLLDQKDTLIRNLATIERAFLDPKKNKGESEMYMLGVKFSRMFKELNKYPEYLKMEDKSSKDKYEVDHISDHDFFQFNNLLELGFDVDIADKFLNPNIPLSEKEKGHKLIILFEHPQLNPKVNKVLALIGSKIDSNPRQNTALVPAPPPPPKVATNSVVGNFLSLPPKAKAKGIQK